MFGIYDYDNDLLEIGCCIVVDLLFLITFPSKFLDKMDQTKLSNHFSNGFAPQKIKLILFALHSEK